MYIHDLKNINITPSYNVLTDNLPALYSIGIKDGMYKGTIININNLSLKADELDYKVSYDICYDGMKSLSANSLLDEMSANIVLQKILYQDICL